MKCLVCGAVALRPMCSGPWEERDCATCGRYRVSDDLLLELMENGQIFDVGKTLAWMTGQREAGELPCIESCDGLLICPEERYSRVSGIQACTLL